MLLLTSFMTSKNREPVALEMERSPSYDSTTYCSHESVYILLVRRLLLVLLVLELYEHHVGQCGAYGYMHVVVPLASDVWAMT